MGRNDPFTPGLHVVGGGIRLNVQPHPRLTPMRFEVRVIVYQSNAGGVHRLAKNDEFSFTPHAGDRYLVEGQEVMVSHRLLGAEGPVLCLEPLQLSSDGEDESILERMKASGWRRWG